jgi:hypothetical protein
MTDQDELFSSERGDLTGSPGPPGPPVVAMCRSNVLEWLSSGLITPKAAFDKYYEDSLAIRDDLVPVVRGPVGGDLLTVERHDAGNFPVLAELAEEAVTWVRDERVGYVARAPLGAVRALHFRSDRDAREFGARMFDNLAVDRVAYRVSPDLFAGGESSLSTASLARDLRGVRPIEPAVAYGLADRLSGARAMALVAASGSTKTLRWAVGLAFGPRTERPPRRKLTSPEDWIPLTARLAEYKVPAVAGLDERIFRAAAATFLDVDYSNVGDTGAILAAIDRRLKQDKTIKDADRSKWEAVRDRITTVLDGAEAFTGFRSDGFRMEKPLLLALLRPEPTRVLTWTVRQTRAGAMDLVVAALLVGLVHGRKSLPVGLRPPSLDELLARRELDDLDGRDVEFRTELVDGDAGLTLRVDDVDVQTVEKPPPTLVEMLDALDVRDATVVAALARAAITRGWHHTVTTRVAIPNGSRFRARDAAIEIEVDGVLEPQFLLRADVFRQAIVGVEDSSLRELLSGLATA